MDLGKKIIIVCIISMIAVNMFSLKKYGRTVYLLGTVVTITIFTKSEDGEKILDGVCKRCSSLEKIFSSRRIDGLVYSINKNGGGEVTDRELLSVLKDALYYHTLTNGAFDPGLYRIVTLWDIEKAKCKPEDAAIRKELEHSGGRFVTLNNSSVVLKNGAGLDLGGIAKGRIIGLLGEYLKSSGVTNYLINAGGDLMAAGLYDAKRPWNIAVADPYTPGNTIGFIMLSDKSIVTSGDYERYFVDPSDGKKYHHIIDPSTGYPTSNGLNSVTVISDDPAQADAMSTALFVMGPKRGLEFARNLAGIEAIFISKAPDGNILYSFTKGVSRKNTESNGIQFILEGK